MNVMYLYDPATGTYTISAGRLQVMLYRAGASKEKIAEEDRLENERRIAKSIESTEVVRDR